jgi:hypothetical protein
LQGLLLGKYGKKHHEKPAAIRPMNFGPQIITALGALFFHARTALRAACRRSRGKFRR